MHDLQGKIRNVVYAIFAIIIGIVLIRVFLKLIGANPTNEFAMFWYELSYVFVEPWDMIYESIKSGSMVIELFSLTAVIFYLIISMVLSKSAGSPFEDSRKRAIAEMVDSFFKVIEFLLVTRFIFKLTGASMTSSFVRFIYDLSNFVHEPFATILPAIKTGDIIFEISTVVALIVIIILDLVTEEFTYSILDTLFPNKEKKVVKKVPVNVAPTYNMPQAPANPAQNITINVPQPGQPQAYVDRRTVNVVPATRVQQVRKAQPTPQRKGLFNLTRRRSSRQGGPANG